MKNIKKLALLFLAFIIISSCEDQENDTFNASSEGFVQLENESAISVVENSTDDIIIDYILDSPKSSAVTFEVSISSADDSRYEVVSGTQLTIPAGETMASLVLRTVNNFMTDGDLDIVVTLSESSSIPIGIAGENVNAITRVITIADDDCPLTIADFVGIYSVEENLTEAPNAGLALAAAFNESYELELSLVEGDVTGTKLEINNTAGSNTYVADGTIITFLSCNGAISFDAGNPVIAEFRTYVVETSPYNESNFTISATGQLGGFGNYELTWTKQ